MTGPPQPAVVTMADLWRELTGMRTDVNKALERLAVLDVRNATADTVHVDHEARLRMLERFKYTLLGAATLAGSAAGVLAGVLSSKGH